jgi:hypothetical protein
VNQGKTVTGEGLCFNVFYKKGEKWWCEVVLIIME